MFIFKKFVVYLYYLIYAAIVWVLLWAYNTIGFKRIDGREMEPIVMHDSFRFVFGTSNKPEDYKARDIVYFEYERKGIRQEYHGYAGRIIARAGDRISMKKGDLYVNGNRVVEDYLTKSNPETQLEEMIIPRDTVFLLFDDREVDYDSKGTGPIGVWAVGGKIK